MLAHEGGKGTVFKKISSFLKYLQSLPIITLELAPVRRNLSFQEERRTKGLFSLPIVFGGL